LVAPDFAIRGARPRSCGSAFPVVAEIVEEAAVTDKYNLHVAPSLLGHYFGYYLPQKKTCRACTGSDGVAVRGKRLWKDLWFHVGFWARNERLTGQGGS
jgi:hypothetical protein